MVSCTLVHDWVRGGSHEFFGGISSTRIALSEGPPQQWSCGIEKAGEILVRVRLLSPNLTCGSIDLRLIDPLVLKFDL